MRPHRADVCQAAWTEADDRAPATHHCRTLGSCLELRLLRAGLLLLCALLLLRQVYDLQWMMFGWG